MKYARSVFEVPQSVRQTTKGGCTHGEYQTGTGDNNKGPAGRRATIITNEHARKLVISDHALFFHDCCNPTPLSQLTGKEELGDNGTRRSVYDIIRSQERYCSSSSPPQTPSADPSQLPKDDFMHETHHAEQPPVHPSSPSSHPPTSSK